MLEKGDSLQDLKERWASEHLYRELHCGLSISNVITGNSGRSETFVIDTPFVVT